MLGASAFGWTYLGEIALDAPAPLTPAGDFDARFGAHIFGWPYLGALPGVFVPPGIVEAEGAAADGSVHVYQGRMFVPVTRPKEETEKKRKEFWPVLPEELEGFDQTEKVGVPTEPLESPADLPTPSAPYLPDRPALAPTKPKPRRKAPAPLEEPVVATPVEAVPLTGIDKKRLIQLAEEAALFGLDASDPQVRKITEDLTMLE